jgi:hypothetical protein
MTAPACVRAYVKRETPSPPLTHTVNLSIQFGTAVPLEELGAHKASLNERGVYLLLYGPPEDHPHFGKNVLYIGKAISETIFTRAQKHAYSITGALHQTGSPRTKPGKRLRAFGTRVGNLLTGLHLVPGYMSGSKSFEVSCAEEWLLWTYRQTHGAIPEANTYAAGACQ